MFYWLVCFPVLRLDNGSPLDLNFGGSAYYNPALQLDNIQRDNTQRDNIQMDNVPGHRWDGSHDLPPKESRAYCSSFGGRLARPWSGLFVNKEVEMAIVDELVKRFQPQMILQIKHLKEIYCVERVHWRQSAQQRPKINRQPFMDVAKGYQMKSFLMKNMICSRWRMLKMYISHYFWFQF